MQLDAGLQFVNGAKQTFDEIQKVARVAKIHSSSSLILSTIASSNMSSPSRAAISEHFPSSGPLTSIPSPVRTFESLKAASRKELQ